VAHPIDGGRQQVGRADVVRVVLVAVRPLHSFVRVLDRVRKQTREVISDVWRQATLLLAAPTKKNLANQAADPST
jgi:hypothetical protein